MDPVICNRCIIIIICIRNPHPANQDSSTRFICKCLCRIDVKSFVKFLKFSKAVWFVLQVKLYRKISTLVHILVIISLLIYSLWTACHNLLAVNLEQIRAFPHITKWLCCPHRIVPFPVFQIVGTKQKCTAIRFRITASLDHIITAVFFIDFWISDMLGHIHRIIIIGHYKLLVCNILSIRTEYVNRILFPSIHDIIIIFIPEFYISCVKIVNSIFTGIGWSAIYTVSVPFFVRIKERLFFFIMNPILCCVMSPKLRSPSGKKWCILEINMIHTLKFTQTIRIIHPACRRHHMKVKSVFIFFYILPHTFMLRIFC